MANRNAVTMLRGHFPFAACASWGASAGGECKPLAEQSWVSVNQQGTTFELSANAIAPLEAVYLSTQPCKNFVN